MAVEVAKTRYVGARIAAMSLFWAVMPDFPRIRRAVIPSEGAKRRSRGIAVVAAE